MGGFFRVLRFPLPIKIDLRDITKLLLKVTLNTITKHGVRPDDLTGNTKPRVIAGRKEENKYIVKSGAPGGFKNRE